MVSVVLLCIRTVSMSKQVLLKILTYEQRVKKRDVCVYFLSQLQHLCIAHTSSVLLGMHLQSHFTGCVTDLQAAVYLVKLHGDHHLQIPSAHVHLSSSDRSGCL